MWSYQLVETEVLATESYTLHQYDPGRRPPIANRLVPQKTGDNEIKSRIESFKE